MTKKGVGDHLSELVQQVEQNFRNYRRIDALKESFPRISRSFVGEIVTERLDYRKLCARWVPKGYMLFGHSNLVARQLVSVIWTHDN